MTERQRRFIDEYVRTGNGAEAAVRAGYSPRRAKETAADLVTNRNVSAAIEAKRRELELTAGIERKHLLGILLKEAARGDSTSGRVAAVREVNRMLGYYAPKQVELSLAFDRMPTEEIERLEALNDDDLAIELQRVQAFSGNGRRR